MTTRASSLTLNLPIAPSRQLRVLIIAAHLAAGLSLVLIELQPVWRLLGWLLIIVHGAYVWRATVWLRNLRQLHYTDGDFYLTLGNDKYPVLAEGGHLVTPWLVILSLKVAGKRRHLPLFQDSCDADKLRRLRVLLRCGAVNHS